MPVNITKTKMQAFLRLLQELGGSAGNQALRHSLEWEEDFYWKIQGRLISDGLIVAGRGRGGSVKIVHSDTSEELSIEEEAANVEKIRLKERELYRPLKESIETRWINKFGFDQHIVDETHSRGSKETGGTYTRPDITGVGIKRYQFLPAKLEIITFEIKPHDAVNVMGVLEAIAHREAAHRAYVIYAISREEFDGTTEAERIVELGQKYGIGILLADEPNDVESWDIMLDAVRNEPDPTRLERFLSDLPSKKMRSELLKWKI